MKNRYFLLRHGQSRANITGIILSHLEEEKRDDYALTDVGEDEVRASVLNAKEMGVLGRDVVIVSSPFSRCKRTAEIAKEVLEAVQDIVFDERLRERWFGDPKDQVTKAESAKDVQKRTVAVIHDLESTNTGKTILLVSHGDALQMMQIGIANQPGDLHQEIPHLETAEIRELVTE